jgi:hypothetical protein
MLLYVVKAVTPSARVAWKYGDGCSRAEGVMPNIVIDPRVRVVN